MYRDSFGNTGHTKLCGECMRPFTHRVIVDGQENDYCDDHPSQRHLRMYAAKPVKWFGLAGVFNGVKSWIQTRSFR